MFRPLALALALALVPILSLCFAAGTATAIEPIDSGWPQVARARDGECALNVTGNGRFYRIAASGLGAGASGRFFVSNGDMKPLDWRIRADGDGEFARYYLPFRHDRNGDVVLGDTVRVAVTTTDCELSTAFRWRRAEVVVH